MSIGKVKYFSLFLILLIYAPVISQTSKDDLLGKYITIKTDLKLTLSNLLYTSVEDAVNDEPFKSKVLYPYLPGVTSQDSMLHKVYKIDSILTLKPNLYYEGTVFLRCINIKSNATIYIRYNEKKFPFLISTSKDIRDDLCPNIRRIVDDFEDKITFEYDHTTFSPYLTKHIIKGKSMFSIWLPCPSVRAGEKGIWFMFTDSTKLAKPDEFILSTSLPGGAYIALVALTPKELDTFTSKTILKYRIHLYDRIVDFAPADRLKSYAQCLKTAK